MKNVQLFFSYKATNIKVEIEETTETKTHNLRRRMGSTPVKLDNGKLTSENYIVVT